MDLQVGRIQNLSGASIPSVPATGPIAIRTTTPLVVVKRVVTVLINREGSPLVCVGCVVGVVVLLVVLKGRVK